MGILRAITYVLVSLASLCIVAVTVFGFTAVYQLGSALNGIGSPTVSTPIVPDPAYDPTEGMTDEQLRQLLDPMCIEANPATWRTSCAN